MTGVYADLIPEDKSTRRKARIRLTYKFDPEVISKIKAIPGAEFIPHSKGGPAQDVPLDLISAKMIREAFGDKLTLSPALRKWGRSQVATARNLSSLSLATTAHLTRLPDKLPALYRALHVGPIGRDMTPEQFEAAMLEEPSFQCADVAFMARPSNCANANQPGMGKTLETIGAVYEGDFENGPKLVIAPVTSLEAVWLTELETWQEQPVLLAEGSKALREEALWWAKEWTKQGKDFWLLVSPAMVQIRKRRIITEAGVEDEEEYVLYPQISGIKWRVITLDEFHKMGLGNTTTGTARACYDLEADKKIALSGTPIGGNAKKVFGLLKFLDPANHTSKWRWFKTWLDVTTKRYDKRGGGEGRSSEVGDIREDRRADFDDMLSRYLTRRTKAECLPWLPPKQYKDIWATMDGKQQEQYEEFAREAEIRIEEHHLAATSILAEYTRLFQFADAQQTIIGVDEDGKALLRPTMNSCKIPHVMQILDERGIRGSDPEGDEQVVIFSQFTQIVDMLCEHLSKQGIPTLKITGKVTGARKRGKIQREFQSDTGPRVLVMNTMAGGVSITLDKASTVVFLDETWNPDDQEQAEDRCHRASRIHQVLCIYIRSKGTLEEYRQGVVQEKAGVNYNILDARRMGLRATGLKK